MTSLAGKRPVLVLRADDVAQTGGGDRGANRRYKNPRLDIETRACRSRRPGTGVLI